MIVGCNKSTSSILRLENTFIEIYLNDNLEILDTTRFLTKTTKNKNYYNVKLIMELLNIYMQYINMLIGSKTPINYNIHPVTNFRIIIPIYYYSRNEMHDIYGTIENKIKIIVNYLENDIDWKQTNSKILWCLRSLKILDVDIVNIFSLRLLTDIIEIEPVDIKLTVKVPELNMPKIITKTFSDGSNITIYNDEYITEYGVFNDLSVLFNDMSIEYNVLHMYEHLSMFAWNGCNGKCCTESNGTTYSNGLSNIYSIHRTKESLIEYTNALLKFVMKSRSMDYWDKNKKIVEVETLRTISETLKSRTMNSHGRSAISAYSIGYDTNIFKYLSNRPFNILIMTYEQINFEFEKIESLIKRYPLNKVPRPKNVIYNYYPFEIAWCKSITGECSKRIDTKNIINHLFSDLVIDFERAFLGIDVMFKSNNDLSIYNTYLHILLYYIPYIENKEIINEYLKKKILPFKLYNIAYSSIPFCYKDLESEDFQIDE